MGLIDGVSRLVRPGRGREYVCIQCGLTCKRQHFVCPACGSYDVRCQKWLGER
jgi:rubrerythrin